MTMWMVRAEVDSRLYQPFLEHSVVAIGWADVGNLDQYKSRDAILSAVRSALPERKPQSHVVGAGMLYRFSQEMTVGDWVITYNKQRRIYAVGKVKGDYRHQPDFNAHDPNVRPVDWLPKEIPRDAFSARTRNTLGSTLTLFLLPPEVEEEIVSVLDDATVPEVEAGLRDVGEGENLLDDIEARSAELIKDRIVKLDWQELQELVAGVLRAMGYKTRVSPAGADHGKDVVASRDGFGFEDPRIVVEVKHRPGTPMGAPDIRSFVGGRHANDKGLYVSTGGFSKDARYEADRANIPVTLLDMDSLVEALLDNYRDLDTDTQRLVPLKRIFWPVA